MQPMPDQAGRGLSPLEVVFDALDGDLNPIAQARAILDAFDAAGYLVITQERLNEYVEAPLIRLQALSKRLLNPEDGGAEGICECCSGCASRCDLCDGEAVWTDDMAQTLLCATHAPTCRDHNACQDLSCGCPCHQESAIAVANNSSTSSATSAERDRP